MRQRQAELSFTDSTWHDGMYERSVARSVAHMGRQEDISYHDPLPEPKRGSFKVICLECGHHFRTSSNLPMCSGCGGVDIELQ